MLHSNFNLINTIKIKIEFLMLPPFFSINTQYIKDLSFENPNTTKFFFFKNQYPNISIGVDVKAKEIEINKYEVVLTINGNIIKEKTRLFSIELAYAGIFYFKYKEIYTQTEIENQLSRFLLINCPEFLFPFSRAIISNITREAGFPSLIISPINFEELYETTK